MEGQADETVHDSAALDDQSVNPVAPASAETEAFGAGLAPELFPEGVPGEQVGGTFAGAGVDPVPGADAGDAVHHAFDPSGDFGELPIPPPIPGDANEPVKEEARGEDGGAQGQQPMDEDGADDDDDLFGDGGDDDDEVMQEAPAAEEQAAQPAQEDEDEQQQQQQQYGDDVTAEEAEKRRRLEYDEESDHGDDDPYATAAAAHETRDVVTAQVPIANYSVPPGGKVWHAKLPGFLEIAPNPFDEKTWEPKEDEVEDEQSQSQAAGEDVKPKKHASVPDENVIRWRWTRDELNQVVKQSNARIVRWSDGTLSLQLGSELFDLSLSRDDSALLTGVASTLPAKSVDAATTLTPTSFDPARSHGLTYLSARHGYNENISETQASIFGTVTMRPAALTSRTHKKLAGAIASRNAAQMGRGTIKVSVQEDPEKARMTREKAEADKAKKAQREARKAAGGGRRGGGKKGAKRATKLEGLDLSDEDEDSDDDGFAASGSRSQPKRGRGGPLNRSYSDEDDDGFLAKSDDDMAMSDASEEEEIEAADAAAEREERRRKDRAPKARSPSPAEEAGAAPRRRLVVESDEE
ncbi:hypothetical protein JCM8097_003429 [Rhodosporidiobolus ruineniae]